MPLNLDIVGQESAEEIVTWTNKDAIIYALGVGAGAADPVGELEFTTENTYGVSQKVLPTYPVVLGGAGLLNLGDFSMAQVLHAEQGITSFAALASDGSLRRTTRVDGIHDKGNDALVMMSADYRTVDGHDLVARTSTTIFVRGEGGFGGDRGESSAWERPDRSPDAVLTYATRGDQALLYRLSGDRNPLHSDPAFAARAGFDRPILHGLCSYGFAGRALLTLVDDDPERFGTMSARFASPVLPGDDLTTSVWHAGDGRHLFEVSSRGRVVLSRGLFEERT